MEDSPRLVSKANPGSHQTPAVWGGSPSVPDAIYQSKGEGGMFVNPTNDA